MNKDLIMSPSQFKEIRNKLIKYSKGRHTVDSLNNSGFSYEDNLLYTLMNSKTYDNLDILPDETDIDEIRKHYEKVTFFMDFVFGGATTTKDKFYELKQQLINNGVYTKYELNKIGFTYDRYQKFGAEAFFRDIHYKKPGKRGPKPKPKGPYNLSLFPKFKPIKTSEEKQLNIGPGQQLFDIPIKEPTTQIPLDFDQTEVKEKFDAYKELQTAKRRKYTQKSIFDAEPEVVSEEEQLKQKIKIKDEILNRQKKKFPYIDSRKQLGTTVPTYPLQFFDASENDFNNQILDFFNQHLNDERNTKHFSAKMVRFSETGMRIRQTKNEGIDKDLFGVTDVVDKRVMVLLPENQKKERAIAIVKQGDGYFKFAEAEMEYDKDGIAFIRNLSIKPSGTFASPFIDVPLKTTLNGSKYINIKNIGDTSSGIQEVLNEDYNKFFDIIFKNNGNVNSITEIATEIARSQRLVNGRVIDMIGDASIVTTRHAVSDQGIYNGRIIISGQNLISSMFADNTDKEKLIQMGYDQGRYALETDENGKIKSIYKAVSNDGIISYEKDDDMFKHVFDKKISQYTDSYVMERAKVVDSDLKNIIEEEDIIRFNKRIRGMNIYSEEEVNVAAQEFRDTIFNNFASYYGYDNYHDLLNDVKNKPELENIYKSFLDKVKRVDLETIKARIETGQLFDNRLVEIKDKTTSAGIERILSGAFLHPLNYLNKDTARKTQGAQQMSSFAFENLSGQRVVMSRIIGNHTNHIKELQSKKITIRKTAEEGLMNLFGKKILGDNFVAPDLSANQVSILYGNFAETFNDSTIISSMASIMNIGDKEASKTIKIPYSTLNADVLKGLGEDFANVGSVIDKLQNGGLDIYAAGQEGSFEYTFLRNLLGESNVKKLIAFKHTDGLQTELEGLGELFSNIEELKTKDDIIEYAKASKEARVKYNQILKKYMLISDSTSRINLINKDVVNKDVKTYVSDATAGLIDNIVATETGIEIKLSLASLQNNGAKMMIGATKATQGGVYDAINLVSGNQNIIVDALVNNKLSSAKRGYAGSVLSLSIESMLRNTMTADFGKQMSNQERIDYFKKMFSKKIMGGKASILDVLNLDIQLDNNGEILFIDKNVEKAINDTDPNKLTDVYTTIEKRIRDTFARNYEAKTGHKADSLQSELMYKSIIDNMYSIYDDVLQDMTQESRDASQIRFINPEIQKIYTGVDGKQHIVKERVQGEVYHFFDRMTRMKETTSRKNSDAMKISRITNLLARTSGNEEFIGLIEQMANEQNKDRVLDFATMYDLDERGNIRNRELFEKFAKEARYIDASLEGFRDIGFGINDTVEGFKKGPLGHVITEVRNADRSVSEKKIKAIINNFDEEFISDINSFFDNKIQMKKELNKIMFVSALDEMIAGNVDLFGPQSSLSSEINNKFVSFRSKVFNMKNSIKLDTFSTKLFNLDGELMRTQNFQAVHSYFIDLLGQTMGITSTEEFNKFKNIEATALSMVKNVKNGNIESSELISYLNDNLGIKFTEDDFSKHFNRTVGQINQIIQNKKITDFGEEGMLDILRSSSALNTDYYKFASSVSNMIDRLTGTSTGDLFEFDNMLKFDNLNADILDKYLYLSSNEVLTSIIKQNKNLSNGKIIHLQRLKQLSINKELPIYITGLLTDEYGRIIPNSGLSDLLALLKENANISANKEYFAEYQNIVNNDVSYIKYNQRLVSLGDIVDRMADTEGVKNQITNTHFKQFLSVFTSGVDFTKIYEDNKYDFYKILSNMSDKNSIVDDEIQKKFDDFKRTIRNKNIGVTSDLSILLEELGVEDAKYMNKLIGLYSGDNIGFEDLIKGTVDLRRILRSVGDNQNKSSLTTINNMINEFEGFIDDVVKQKIMPTLQDFQKIAVNAMYRDKMSDNEFQQLISLFANTPNNYEKMRQTSSWLTPFVKSIYYKAHHYDNKSNTTEHIIERIIGLYEKMGLGFFGKGGYLTEAGTYVAENSARISPRDASHAHTIVTDTIKNAFSNNKRILGKKKNKRNKKAFLDIRTKNLNDQLDEVEDFVNVIYGEDVAREIHNKLEVFKQAKHYNEEDLLWINNFLADKQNIVVGTDRMFQVTGLKLEFAEGQHYAYGFLQRDPSQFHGSFASTRFVKIDMNDKRFKNNMFMRLLRSTDGIDNTGNLMFIGRMTGMWANGDFDGDTFQVLINGLRNKELFNQVQENSGELLEKSLRLQNLIVNSGDTNLIKEFNRNTLRTENSKAIRELIIQLYGDKDLNENSTNEEVFSKIKDYYLTHRYYRRKIKDALADEIAKHADTKLTGFDFDGISASSIMDLNINLSVGQIKRIRNGEMDIKEFSDILSTINFTSEKSLNELKSNDVNVVFGALKKALTPQGDLGLSNLFGQENKILDFTSIARTGRFHDAISEYREFSSKFKNEAFRAVFKELYGKEIEQFYGKDAQKVLDNLFDNISTTLVDDIFGDLIEKGSIGGKHGASSNPYEIIEQLNAIAKISGRGNNIDYLYLDEANNFIRELLQNSIEADDKIISEMTIGDLARSLFIKDPGKGVSNYKMQKKISDMSDAIGEMLGIKNDASVVKFADIEGITASQLAGVVETIKTAAAKGHLEKISNTTNISRGLAHKLASKESVGSKIVTYFKSVYRKKTGRKASGELSQDTSASMGIIRKAINLFTGSKQTNEDVKNAAEESSSKISDEEIKQAKAYSEKINTDGKTKKASETLNDKDVEQMTRKQLRDEISVLQDSSAKQRAQIEDLQNQLNKAQESINESVNNSGTTNTIKKKASKVADEAVEATKKAKEQIMKHKKGFMIAGAAVILGSFFKIFQSNRPVVNLDINEKQYEKSQGSIYRDLNQYTINTNIRELY